MLSKEVVLALNANWERIGYVTVERAIIKLTGGIKTEPALALRIESDDEGNVTEMVPTKWDDWVKLPVREKDLTISTSQGPIRCPLVVIEQNYSKMPTKAPRLSNDSIHERDGYIDQYTNEKLTRNEASVDHVIPRDVWKRLGLKGSPDTWTNMVTCRKDRNHKKGNRMNHEVGLKLIRRPYQPKEVPLSFFINKPRHELHLPFFPEKAK